MITDRNQDQLKRLTLILGIIVAIVAGFHTTAKARENDRLLKTEIAHEEIVDLLAYLWENDQQHSETLITVYDSKLEMVYQGALSELEDPQVILGADVLMKDGNHTIYMTR